MGNSLTENHISDLMIVHFWEKRELGNNFVSHGWIAIIGLTMGARIWQKSIKAFHENTLARILQ